MLSVVRLNDSYKHFMLSVVKLSVIRLNDNYNPFVLSAVMLNVAAK